MWLFRYIRESRSEMKKVTWPSKQDTTKYAVITIVICLVFASFFGGLDWLVSKGLEWLIKMTS